jgi:hypothetical protein
MAWYGCSVRLVDFMIKGKSRFPDEVLGGKHRYCYNSRLIVASFFSDQLLLDQLKTRQEQKSVEKLKSKLLQAASDL